MRPGSIALGVAAAAVAVGGIYLFLSLGDDPAAQTPEQALAAARAEAGDPPARRDADDRAADKARSALPQRRPPRATFDPDAAERVGIPAPQVDYRKGGDPLPNLDETPTKYRPDLVNPQEYEAASADQSDHLIEANKLYDKGDFDGARQLAQKMLGEMPGNVRLLRVVVSSSCILGDGDVAQKYATQLPPADLDAMAARCSKFDIKLR